MSNYEVPQPILNSSYDAPAKHWHIIEGEPQSRVQGRRKPAYRQDQALEWGFLTEPEVSHLARQRERESLAKRPAARPSAQADEVENSDEAGP
jgi:hypothetical protein